jgi:hypothetical protein
MPLAGLRVSAGTLTWHVFPELPGHVPIPVGHFRARTCRSPAWFCRCEKKSRPQFGNRLWRITAAVFQYGEQPDISASVFPLSNSGYNGQGPILWPALIGRIAPADPYVIQPSFHGAFIDRFANYAVSWPKAIWVLSARRIYKPLFARSILTPPVPALGRSIAYWPGPV